jgi:two-component system response regulator HydG/two-component system response regulator AtoC
LHYLSKRAGNPFVIVNCSSIPEALVESILFGHKRGAFTGAVDSVKGRFEVAEEGTVFLDEIGDMPVSQQSSLLRVLEYRRFTPVGDNRERECRARFVLATNRDLREGVREGTFREDLFYRVNVATVQMPPLRARPEDIPALVDHYHRRISAEMGRVPGAVHPEVIRLFQQYDWPGNVRELKNVIEAALMLRDRKEVEITPRDLPPELLAVRAEGSPTGPALSPQERQEKQELIRALQQCQWNQTKAAQVLGCHRNTVRARLRYFGLSGRPEE